MSEDVTRKDPAPESPGRNPYPAKILAVDDDEANLVALSATLAELGEPIVCVRSGEEALRLLLKDNFAIILLDVRMPGMDGYETAAFIRDRQRNSHVPIIFLSAVDKEERHLFKGYAAGAVDYVFKPIEPVVLRAKVKVFIELHAKAQEIRRHGEQERRLLKENLRVRAEQLETAEALRRSMAQQSLVIDSLPIALFVASRKDGCRARRFVGGKLGELLSLSEAAVAKAQADWMDQVHESDRDRLETAFHDLESTKSVTTEYRIRCGDGGYHWVSERLSLNRQADGNGAEMVGVLLDISARKTMEEQIAHAQKMEAIGQMTGGIAHDFNNMLGVVLGSLQRVLSQDEIEPKMRRRLDLAMQAAQSCADLTKRLLGFGRRQSLDPRLIRLDGELQRLDPLFRRLLGKNCELTIECPRTIWPIHLDASQLEAAVVNLAINARDAMAGGGALRIVCRNLKVDRRSSPAPDLSGGDYVEISVIDSGAGMTAEVRERALEPFFTTKKVGKGTGLGLSSIYGFVNQSGGGLSIDSEPGRGTAIRLYFPRSEMHRNTRIRKRRNAAPADFSGCRVLVVEDEDPVREMTVSMLLSIGCAVEEAASGDIALRMEPGLGEISVLFTDCVMPGDTDGAALAGEFMRRRPGLPVLMTSGNRTAPPPELQEAGDVRFLPKPYDQEQLAEELAVLIAARR